MRILCILFASLFFLSCSSHLLKYEEKDFEEKGDYHKEIVVEIEEKKQEPIIEKEPALKPSPKQVKTPKKEKPKEENKKASKKKKSLKKEVLPYRSGERVSLIMTYFKMTAGRLVFEVGPMVKVNKDPSYQLIMTAETLKLFEMVYKVKNQVKTYVSKKTGLPYSYELDVNESKKIRQGRAVFDYKNNEVRYWEKLYKKNDGLKEIKENWPLKDKAQNAYSALFNFRKFPMKVGEKYTMWVVHNNEKIKIDFHALKKEKITIKAGEFDTIVVQPKTYKKGKLDKDSNVLFWLSDDDQKLILKIEADVKLGTLKGEAESINW